MQSIQRLRARALASGALRSTPQQQVVVQDNTIEILPAEPGSVYAPAYDAGAVDSDEPNEGYGGPSEDFGPALPAGPWLCYGLDWAGYSVWVGGLGAWQGPDGWHHTHDHGGHGPPGSHRWKPHAPVPGSPAPAHVWHGQSVLPSRPGTGAADPPPRPNGPGAQAGAGPAVPAPRTPAPPMDRPRLAPLVGAGAPAPQAEARATQPGGAAETAAPSARSAPARAPEPAAARAAAPALSRESAPAPSHESAPAAEARSH
jgi:hypothetical protein